MDVNGFPPYCDYLFSHRQCIYTHLISVVQVNRSSLLVPVQVPKPQEVNGTNGKAALPVTETIKQTEHSTDSDEEEGGDTDDPGSSKEQFNF